MQRPVIILFTIILSLSLISNYSCTEQTNKAYEQSTVPITNLYAAKERNDLGVELTNEAKYEEAITEFTHALKIYPSYTIAYYNRGNAYCCIGEFKKAIEDYNIAIRLNIEFHEAYNKRGLAYTSMNDFSMAIADYTEAIKIRPSHAEYYYNRGCAYLKMGMESQALTDLNQCIELSEDSSLTQKALQSIEELQSNLY